MFLCAPVEYAGATMAAAWGGMSFVAQYRRGLGLEDRHSGGGPHQVLGDRRFVENRKRKRKSVGIFDASDVTDFTIIVLKAEVFGVVIP